MIISVNGISDVIKYPISSGELLIFMDINKNVFYAKSKNSYGTVTIGTYKFEQEDLIHV